MLFVYLASTFIVFWERDITSESHGTPVHISTTVYTLNLLLVLLSVTTIIISRVDPFVNGKAGGIDNPSVLVGSKVICICVQFHVKRRDTFLYFCESYWRQTLVSLPREICRYATSHLPLGVTSEEHYFSAIRTLTL